MNTSELTQNLPIIFNTGSNFQLRALGCTSRQYLVRVRTQFVEYDLAVEARQFSKEKELASSSFQTLLNFKPMKRFTSILCKSDHYNVLVCTLSSDFEIRSQKWTHNPCFYFLNTWYIMWAVKLKSKTYKQIYFCLRDANFMNIIQIVTDDDCE